MPCLLRQVAVFCCVLLAGCSTYMGKPEVLDHSRPNPTADQIPTPPPVTVSPTPLPVDGNAKPVVALPQTQATASPVTVPTAAAGLIKQAEQQEKEGNLTMASSSLERALRIAPNSAEVYYRLARVRDAQGQHEQAVQFARRGLALGADSALQEKLQAIVAGN